MRRRELSLLLAGAMTSAPAPRAQQKAMPVIGILGTASPGAFAPYVTAFRQGLSETGYVEGQNVAIEYRWAEGHYDRLPALVADLVARKAPGTIVNIMSTSAHAGQPYLAPYVAAKAGLAGLTRNAAHAHRWDRIRINGLNIGWTDTEGEDATQRRFHGADDDWRAKAGASLPMGKLGQVGEIAEFVAFLLSDRSGVVTGSVIDWDQNVLGGMD